MTSPRLLSSSIACAFAALCTLPACGDDSSKTTTPAKSGGGGGGMANYDASAAGGKSGGAGGASTSGTDGGNSCPSMSFSLAPVPCSQDFSHAQLTYTLACDDPNAKGYLAACAPYDAVIAHEGDIEDFCFYSKRTGNLIGSLTEKAGVRQKCLSFDLTFAAPDPTTCTPVLPGTCPP